MRKIRLIWPGKTREPFIKSGIEKYLKLLKPYAGVEVLEVREGRGRGVKGRDFESENIIKVLKADFILLDAKGTVVTSEGFAELIRGFTYVDFVTGGPFGVSEKVRDRAKRIISLSQMTFTHELTRLILLEQIYRAMTIIHGKDYHH